MTTEETIEEARVLADGFHKKGFSNLEALMILQMTMTLVQIWQTQMAIKQLEIEGSGGYSN